MKSRLLGILIAGLLASGFAEAQDVPPRSDLAKLQGTWRGKIAGGGVLLMVIHGNSSKSTIFGRGGTYNVDREIKIDETAEPKVMDFVLPKGVKSGEPSLSIYKLEGDSLTVCTDPFGKNRPKKFAEGKNGGMVVVYSRVVGKSMPAAPDRALPKGAKTYAGATITEINRSNVLLRTAQGPVQVRLIVDKAFGLDGKPLDRPLLALKKGNVVDVIVAQAETSQQLPLRFVEVRLVKGELAEAPKPNAAKPGLRRAVVAKVNPYNVVLTYDDGEEVTVDKGAGRASTIDGKPLPAGAAARMLRQGNVLEVVVAPKLRRELFATIREIRLIEGQLLEAPK